MYFYDEFWIRLLSEEKQWSSTTDTGIKIVPGVTVSDGECKTYTLGYEGNVHGVVDVKDGISSKQDFLHSLIASCCYKHSPEHLELQIIQCKRTEPVTWITDTEHNVYSPHIISLTFGEKVSNNVIKKLSITANARYEKLSRLGYRDVLSYNKDVHNGGFKLGIIPRRLVIINAADILFEKKDEAVIHALSYLAKIGRAVGIHIIYVFDNRDAVSMDTMTEAILNQCSLRFKLYNDSEVECQGIEDGTPVFCAIPLRTSQNMIDIFRNMWESFGFSDKQ